MLRPLRAEVRVMSQLSRPYQIALLAVVALLGLWLVALKPKSSGSGPSTPAPATSKPASKPANGILSAPAKARSAVTKANAAGAASAGTTTLGSAPGTVTTPVTTPATTAPAVTHPSTTATDR